MVGKMIRRAGLAVGLTGTALVFREAIRLFRETSANEVLRKHWFPTAVLTDSIGDYLPETKENEVIGFGSLLDQILATIPSAEIVPEDELLPGELSAVVFQIGYYFIRAAQKVYHRNRNLDDYKDASPASKEEVQFVREHSDDIFSGCRKKYMVATEISANVVNYAAEEMHYVCNTIQPVGYSWHEEITAIITAKKGSLLSTRHEHLWVCITWYGESDTVETWYDLNWDGKTSTFSRSTNPYRV